MQHNDIRIIGIDPAPQKKSTVFNGRKLHAVDFRTLKRYVDYLAKQPDKILICWDAPLLDYTEGEKPPYFKEVETIVKRYFYKGNNKKKEHAEGVSVMPFATCPHWTISRYVLGLPRFSEYDSTDIPFQLIESEDNGKYCISHSIVEVHPAVGIYVWNECKLHKYKGQNDEPIKELWNAIKIYFRKNNINIPLSNITPNDDDELDAIVAYLLGVLWVQQPKYAKLYGNKKMGAMLLPVIEDLEV